MGDGARTAGQRQPEELSLKHKCFQAVRKHLAALSVHALLDLPPTLIKELLHHLTICQLDELQPVLNHRGISTFSAWVRILLDMCGPKHVIDLQTEEEAKLKVMKKLFAAVFYGVLNPYIRRNLTDLNTPSILWAAAKCIRHFALVPLHKPLEGLTAEQRPLLNLLEKHIRSVGVSNYDGSKRNTEILLYVLHRLLDHGVADELVVHSKFPWVLSWLLHGRGSQYVDPELQKLMHSEKVGCNSHAASASAEGASGSPSLTTESSEDEEDQPSGRKRSRMDSFNVGWKLPKTLNCVWDPQVLCQMFSPCDASSAGACQWGRINCLEIRNCDFLSMGVLTLYLPTFFCLRSLTLHSYLTFSYTDVWNLASALRELYRSSHSSLMELTIGVLPHRDFMGILLDSSPNLTSLQVEIQCVTELSPHATRTAAQAVTVPSNTRLYKDGKTGLIRIADGMDPESGAVRPSNRMENKPTAELPLEKLTVKVAELQSDLHFITSVLRCSPHLTNFHAAGIRLSTDSSHKDLLTTLSESNLLLTNLHLEDIKLSDCLPEILNLLRDCRLEELTLNDCRLLETGDTEGSLQQLVAALKTVPSLHTLSLAQNRLTKNVCVLAELFSGCTPSSVKRLDISSNFIQPAELLEFTDRLKTHRPPHQLTLDLRKNPADRDPDTWNTAIKRLRPFCLPLFEGWISTNTMADHVSNM